MPKPFDVVRLVSGETATILDDHGDGWFEVEIEASEGCPSVETINQLEIEAVIHAG